MNLNRLILPLGVVSALFSACMPYPPNPNHPLHAGSPDPAPVATGTVDSEAQERIRRQREQARLARERETPPVDPVDKPDTPPPPTDFRTGIPVPGKEGFVFNPFTNGQVDVRAIPSGTLIRDPNDPNPDHKFRVP